jgi:hypothetical protein
LVKVGTTTQLAKRLRALQLSSPVPLEVLWSAPGDRGTEAALHQRFAHLREHGEWFDFGNDDPVGAVQAAMEAGLPEQRRATQSQKQVTAQPLFDHSLCECGHELSFHPGRPRACTVVGWDEWLDCSCERFVLATPEGHVGLPVCEHCGHPARDHRGVGSPCSWEGDMWRVCRCPALVTSGVAR